MPKMLGRFLIFVFPLASISGFAMAASPLQVKVSVAAADPSGNALSYRWASTDGVIVNSNSPSTVWTLPDGVGIILPMFWFQMAKAATLKAGWR